MHVISRKKLMQFWAVHPDAGRPLRAWYRLARQSRWQSFAELRAGCASADQVGRFTVFNVGGNKYRLIAAIHFNRGKVYIRHVLTHKEYDRGEWQSDQTQQGPFRTDSQLSGTNPTLYSTAD